MAWSAKVLAELEAFEATKADDLEGLIQEQVVREKEARDLAREYNGLSHEWKQADGVSDADRAAIRSLSLKAQELSAIVQQRFKEVQKLSEDRARKKQGALTNLRQRRRSVTIYRPESVVTPGFVDKKA